MSRQGGH